MHKPVQFNRLQEFKLDRTVSKSAGWGHRPTFDIELHYQSEGRRMRNTTLNTQPRIITAYMAVCVMFAVGSYSTSTIAQESSKPDTLAAVCEAAGREVGPALWYEASQPAAAAKVIAAFNRTYPKLKVQHVSVAGGVRLAAQVINESRAKTQTASLVTGSFDVSVPLAERKLLETMTKKELGITDDRLLPSPSVVVTSTGILAIMYNTDLLKGGDVPKRWEDLNDSKLKGKTGGYIREGILYATLENAWGKDKTLAFVKDRASNRPILDDASFTIAQRIASGSVPVGVVFYQAYMPFKELKAPVAAVLPEPVPINTAATYIVKNTPQVNTAKCFVGWLVTPAGATSYEEFTYRGNGFVQGTKMHEQLKGLKTVTSDFDQIEEFTERTLHYNKLLAPGAS
jgi:iron(III) transport system substrate-binding protein